MLFTKKIIFFIVFLLLFSEGRSTHIVGGEIFYDCLGNDRYRITLKVYRDCYNGIPGFDNPLALGIFSKNGVLMDSLMLALPGSRILPKTINNPCFIPPSDVCVEEAVYITETDLPPIPGGYYVAYQRCCRNHTILNINNPGAVGATYFNNILDTSLVRCNSSPRFVNFPPIFICEGVPLVFDHSATDPDGDSLAYELCDTWHGGNTMNPIPQPPFPPPYTQVPYLSPYSGIYPMSSSPVMRIDPYTGLLTGTPDLTGQWVVGVCVKEYRKGKLLNTHKRDFQFNVVQCPGLVVASIPRQTVFCGGLTVNFSNTSVNAWGYHWDFGDRKVTNDTSNLHSPSYTYGDTGVYSVTLIVNPGTLCADTATSTFRIYPRLDAKFSAPPPQCIKGNNFSFSGNGNFTPNTSLSWNFGPQANPPSSSLRNPAGIVYQTSGRFPVRFTVSDYGCTETVTDTVVVYPLPQAAFNALPQKGCAPYGVQFSDSSISGTTLSYFWEFGDGSTSTLSNPYHVYAKPGIYDVRLTIITSNGCIDTVTFSQPKMITVMDLPEAGFTVDPKITSIFTPDIRVKDQSRLASGCTLYFGDGTSVNACEGLHSYRLPGKYTIMQVVTNEAGCRDTLLSEVEIKPEYRFYVPNAFTPNDDGMNDVFIPVSMGVIEYQFIIFDRWGNLIFETTDPGKGWDGKANGGEDTAQQDVYVYMVKFRDVVDLAPHSFVGSVTLIR